MKSLDAALLTAYDNGIQVILAKRPEDLKIVGIHVVEPTQECLARAINDAVRLELYVVVIHSSAIWRSWK